MKTAIALSGGVDSAVAAYILKQKKHELFGITFELFESQKENLEKAKNIAQLLKIPYYILDLKDFFKKEIIKYFVNSYAKGITPNPCAWCNKKIKFGKVLEAAIKTLNIEKFATGHYVRISIYKGFNLLRRAKDKKKDQSYFLSLIDSRALKYLIFPLGDLTKEEVKNLGKELFNFSNYKESQDICFLKGKSLKDFLSEYLPEKEGSVLYKGRIVGTHPGIHWFTIGQRKGLRIPLRKPLYIIELDYKENKIVLGEEKDLFSRGLILEKLNFHLPLKLWDNPLAQIRYKAPLTKVKDMIKTNKEYKVFFEDPIKSITPGQICAFYEEDFLLGGGIIKSTIK